MSVIGNKSLGFVTLNALSSALLAVLMVVALLLWLTAEVESEIRESRTEAEKVPVDQRVIVSLRWLGEKMGGG